MTVYNVFRHTPAENFTVKISASADSPFIFAPTAGTAKITLTISASIVSIRFYRPELFRTNILSLTHARAVVNSNLNFVSVNRLIFFAAKENRPSEAVKFSRFGRKISLVFLRQCVLGFVRAFARRFRLSAFRPLSGNVLRRFFCRFFS